MFPILITKSYRLLLFQIHYPFLLVENDGNELRHVLHFATVQSKDEFKNTYLVDENNNPISSIYFKFFISITTDPSSKNEYVPGYLKNGTHYDINNSANYGYFIKNGKSFGYLKINCIPIRDVLTIDCEQFISLLNDKGGANPISQVAWNFTRSNLPRIDYKQANPTVQSGADFVVEVIWIKSRTCFL